MTTKAPERDLGSMLVELTRLIRRRSHAALEPYGLSPAQGRAFRVISHHRDADEELRLSGLAERLRIAPRSTTEVVDRLETLGLVRRSPSPSDRRATVLTLTDKGEQLRRTLDRRRVESTEDLFAALSDTERDTLGRLLRKALDAADAG
ncbi:MarR family winged helix-turn-helix transcriptional regulator [Luteipulveratus flavus]|uniref:MarR family transcriptional regulator n=1 Tax=Luteipulveratus flavus TaxID=3031728 RepID=A0ABT6C7D6_9MICO|nr:MarR family transcriptional regulator [Luteipulveratus sp. YIM 133296]MDF8264621.1 MarR family transcriptional regulator [Luteipulveratus sp. YIM 133296]